MLETLIPPLGVACAGAVAWAIRAGVKYLIGRKQAKDEQERTSDQRANEADRTEGKLLLDRFTVLGEQQEAFTDGLVAATRRLSQAVARRDRIIEAQQKELAEVREAAHQHLLDIRSLSRDLDEANARAHRLQVRLDGYSQGRKEDC